MKGMLVDITKGSKPLLENRERIIFGPVGEMSYFPMCCSTGIFKGLQASTIRGDAAPLFDKIEYDNTIDLQVIKDAKYLHELIRETRKNRRFIWPIQVARWYALSLILQKVTTGKDDSGDHTYGNYKAAQICMFDRLLEDKDPKKGFRFTYNRTYSCDHLMDWLDTDGRTLGEVLVSTAVPGGHKARVRGCIFTPDIAMLQEYHDERIKQVREHVLATVKYLKTGKKVKNTQW